MLDAIRNMDKKYLTIMGVLVAVLLFMIILFSSLRGCSKSMSHGNVEKKMVEAAKKYYEKNNKPSNGLSSEVSASELTGAGYMKKLTSFSSDKSCNGKVVIHNNNGIYLYIPDLKCDNYNTKHLSDIIIKDNKVSDNEKQYKAGLYEEDNRYVFKGKNPNNYISFRKVLFRIIDIDKSTGIMRVIKTQPQDAFVSFDTKYNIDVKSNNGINDYENSALKEVLTNDYNKFKEESKRHLAPFNVCIGKRFSTELSIDRNIDCSNVLEKQYIGVISLTDYMNASLDENCDSVINGACTNYNYFYSFITSTLTSTTKKDNSYDIAMLSGGLAYTNVAGTPANYNWVLAFHGDELYTSGNGSKTNPYIINDK